MGMAMPSKTLFLARLDGGQVASPTTSSATGTGAFLLDPGRHTMAYQLTYQGLESGGARTVALFNFGRGRNGALLEVLCGGQASPCPDGASATISGSFSEIEKRRFDNVINGELDSERVYVEIEGRDGKPEIRGQLAPNGAMVPYRDFVAHLTPLATLARQKGAHGSGSGTAIMSEVYLPGGVVSMFYVVTVAGASGPPTRALLVGVPAGKDGASPGAFKPKLVLPAPKIAKSRSSDGGTLSGAYKVARGKAGAPLPAELIAAGSKEIGLVVSTSRAPDGELFGTFMPVN